MNDCSCLRLFIRTLAALLAGCLCWACTDEGISTPVPEGLEPGTPVELSLGIGESASGSRQPTRATTSTPINRQVFDLYVFIFNEDPSLGETGALKSKYYFPTLDQNYEVQCDPDYSSSPSAKVQGSLLTHMHTTAGKSRIVAVANCAVSGSAMILDSLNNVTRFDQLQDFMVSTIDATSNSSDLESPLPVMSGFYCNPDQPQASLGNGAFCQPENGGMDGKTAIGAAALPGKLWLTPLRSRVKFVIYGQGHNAVKDSLGNETVPQGHFDITSWQVVDIPASTPLFCRGSNPGAFATVTTPVSTHSDHGTDVIDETGQPATSDHTSGFVFFMADNHPGKGREIDSYAQRSAWDTSAGVPVKPEDKKFVNVPPGATCVVIRGHYSGASEVTEETSDGNFTTAVSNVSTEVTYQIFLGHDSETDFADYNVFRNYDYTYVVRIKGVNTISVEVNKNTDTRPDYEGHVVAADMPGIDLDAHYGQRTVTLSKKHVKGVLQGGDFRVRVTVPMFGVDRRYQYAAADGTLTQGDPENALPYMDWIEVHRHTGAEEDQSYVSYTAARGSGAEPATMNVKEFLADLYQFANDPAAADDATRTYTLYFDEYLYDCDPGNPSRKVTWKDILANGQPRTFTMLGSTRYSADHNSSFSTQGTVFKQKCMQTVYDTSSPTLQRAWAVESMSEDLFAKGDPTIPAGTFLTVPHQAYQTPPSSIYGRQNCWEVLHGSDGTLWHFNRIIDADGYLKPPARPNWAAAPDETNLFSVCMQRNRDLNGNGLIDRDELRWYLPSLEQLQTLYIGSPSLSADIRLYDPALERANLNLNDMTYPTRHFLTSSNNEKLWAEEGCSNSPLGLVNPPQWNLDKKLYLRCVRDLGTDGDPDSNYEDIYQARAAAPNNTHAGGTILMSNLAHQSRRNYTQLLEIPGEVHTFTTSNNPVYEFQWADTVIRSSRTIDEEFAAIKAVPQQPGQCAEALGKGWRLPTLPEMITLYWAMGSDGNKLCNNIPVSRLATRTRFVYQDQGLSPEHMPGHPRQYHMYDNTDVNTGGQFTLNASGDEKEVLYLRCVRDVVKSQ